jgi:hypothetical protein
MMLTGSLALSGEAVASGDLGQCDSIQNDSMPIAS